MLNIYLDNNASSMVAPEVFEAMAPFFNRYYGNAGSVHRMGILADRVLYESRKKILQALMAEAHQVVFTSGGTESNNLAVIGAALAKRKRGKHIVTTGVEHPAVLEPLRLLEQQGFEVSYINPREDGIIHTEDIVGSLRPDTILVSVMHINNETGALHPIEEIARAVKNKNPECLVHSDGVQAIGKIKPSLSLVDFYAVSGHKFHAPKGIGALIIREGARLMPVIYGGGQENGYRSGTENITGIIGLTKALELAYENFDEKIFHYKKLREGLLRGLEGLEDVVQNSPANSTPQTTNISFLSIPGDILLNSLSESGVYVATGSACSHKKQRQSHVLQAMGISEERIDSSIRFSFSRYTTIQEIEETVGRIRELVPKLRLATR